MRLDDPVTYKQVMTYPLKYVIYARTANHEEYEMWIVAKDETQAEQAAKQLCAFLGLEFAMCTEVE